MHTVAPPARTASGSLAIAAIASIGAGAIHAVAAGSHSEHQQAMWVFIGLAVVQIAWGALALRWPHRAVAAGGALLGAVALGGWIAAKVSGIGFVDGLEAAEAVQTSDLLAASLAFVAFVGCALRLTSLPTLPRLAPAAAVVLIAAVVPGMVAAGGHAHDEGHDDGSEHAHGDTVALAAADHPEGDHPEGDHPEGEHADGEHADGEHEGAVVPPEPYDPEMPINLSGVEGVSKKQQARAENLIAITLHHLPQFADPAVAEAGGWHSIGDGGTGYEHFVNRELIDDGEILDPNFPESLVYQVIDGERQLVAAMYMMGNDDTLDDVPDVGGKLTQWHIHDNLCFTPDPVAPKVGGLTNADGSCNPPLVKGTEAPMLHVWIVPHECGPFAALDGIAGGQIKEDEERWCDHAHGA
jgi:hypothetical protein